MAQMVLEFLQLNVSKCSSRATDTGSLLVVMSPSLSSSLLGTLTLCSLHRHLVSLPLLTEERQSIVFPFLSGSCVGHPSHPKILQEVTDFLL